MPAVRLATEADAASVVDLRRRLFAETPFMLWESAEFVQTVEDERKRIASLNTRPNCLSILAEHDSDVVGLLTAVGGDRNRQRHSATLALGVAKAYWGHGIATAMVREAIEWSARTGLKRLELTVHTSNLAALAVYLRCGFQVEGVRRSSLFVDGKYVDEYLMSLLHAG